MVTSRKQPLTKTQKQMLRAIQQQAFAQIQTIDWWFRRQYNLSPNDPRYLDMTRIGMQVDYWCHELSERMEKASKTTKVETLDDLLDSTEAGISDEEFDRRLIELEAQDAQQQATSPSSRVAPDVAGETVISFRRRSRA